MFDPSLTSARQFHPHSCSSVYIKPTGCVHLLSHCLWLVSTVVSSSLIIRVRLLVMAFHTIEGVQWLERRALVEHNPALPPPRQSDAEVVSDEFTCGDAKDIVELLESSVVVSMQSKWLKGFGGSLPLLGLWKPEEDHAEGDHIQSCIEADGSDRRQSVEHEREGD